MKNIIFIAPPAAGKGTISGKIETKYNVPHISTGDILREAAKDNNEVKELLATGNLVDDNMITSLIKERIMLSDCNNGYILDGFPRTVNQAELYQKILDEVNKNLGIVIYIDVPKQELKQRLTGRSTCEVCNSIFNDYHKPLKPKVEGICNECGGKLVRRSDDNEESFETRYSTFMEKTEPLVKYYEEKGILKRVNALSSQENFESIVKILEGTND